MPGKRNFQRVARQSTSRKKKPVRDILEIPDEPKVDLERAECEAKVVKLFAELRDRFEVSGRVRVLVEKGKPVPYL